MSNIAIRDNSDLVRLSIDARRNRVKNFSEGRDTKVDEAARARINEIFGVNENEKISDRLWKHHKEEYYEYIEDVINETTPDSWDMSDFYRELVEVKNGRLGDKNDFIVQDKSILLVSKFSGNHWDIDRQRLPAGKSFSVDTEWYAVMVYDELERFRKGVITLVQMFDAIQRSIQQEIDDRIYASFNGAGAYLPTQFKETGSFNETALNQLIERVSAESHRNVRLAGSRAALAKVYRNANSVAFYSNEMKNDMNTTGHLGVWQGLKTIEIPQSFKRGTYDFRNPDDMIYVLPENYKPIKLYFEGETRSRELDEYQNHDQTISYQVQTKLGVGVVFDTLFGTYQVS